MLLYEVDERFTPTKDLQGFLQRDYRMDQYLICDLPGGFTLGVFSVSPQMGKDERPFLGVIIVCNEHVSDLTNTANVFYQKYISGENFAARELIEKFAQYSKVPEGKY